MKDKQQAILYIGKAKNIRQRVKQYFLHSGDTRVMVPFLVTKVESIETIVVHSEKEALLLENNLIKQHTPKFNALLKDDKTFIALKMAHKHTWPTLSLVRYRGKPPTDGIYFGPYTSAHSARTTLDLLQRLFPLRQCSDQEFVRRTRPCILYGMKRCLAPCVGFCSREEYDVAVQRTIKFLRGQDKEVLRDLYEEMQKNAHDLEFEKAASLLKIIRQIEQTLETQTVDKPLKTDTDVINIFRHGDEVVLCQLLFRSGKLVGSRHYPFSNIAQEDQELLESFLLQHYREEKELPHEILLPQPLAAAAAIAELLSQNSTRKVAITWPQRGDKRALVQMAYVNAEATFKREKDAGALREKNLLELQEKLHLQNYPERIECFDNSHISGDEPVAVLVAFNGGLKESKRYRTYKIKSGNEGADDYASMYEVLRRRYSKAKEENDLPDLVVVDGGKGHLNVALKVMAQLNIINVDVIAIVKEEGRHDKGETREGVFLPDAKDPIYFRPSSPLLFFLQNMRDEAHRFAITFQRKRRSKKLVANPLDALKGIGPKRRKAILRYFGSVKKLKEASEEELHNVPGLTAANVATLRGWVEKEKGT